MPVLDLNFAVPPFTEGNYRLVCDKAIYKKNSAGDGFIGNLQMHIEDSPLEDYEGEKVFDNVSFKTSARWRLQEVLRAFTGENWESDNMELVIDDDNHIEVLENATAIGILYSSEYNGRQQIRVKNYIPDNGTVEIGLKEEDEEEAF